MVVGWALIALGLFTVVLPFVGPLFGFGMGPDPAWEITTSRIVRHVIPGAAVIIGGVMLLPRSRASRSTGVVLALLGGAWITVAPVVLGKVTEGAPPLIDIVRPLVYHFGTGLVIAALAAVALGRFTTGRTEAAESARAERRRERVRAA